MMIQKAEIERMEAAFNRAAEKAVHGTREERSGKFLVQDNKHAESQNEVTPGPSQKRP